MFTSLSPSNVIDQRLDEAFRNAGVSRFAFENLKGLLRKISDRISSGCSVFMTVGQLSRIVDRCEKTVRTWLENLSRAGVITKRRAGPNGLEIELHPDFYKDSRRERAIDLRIEQMGDSVRSRARFRIYLRENMSEEEIDDLLACDEAPSAPREPAAVEESEEAAVEVLDEEPSENEEDTVDEVDELAEEPPVVSEAEIDEAAQWRVQEKQKTPGFTGFIRGARSYFEATRRKLRQHLDQVPEIIERKKAAEEKALQEEEKRRRAAELATEEAARAREETERRKALIEAFEKRPEEERRDLTEQAEARLPRNIRGLRADHPARIKRLERELLVLLEPKIPKTPPRDFSAELALRLAQKRRALEPG